MADKQMNTDFITRVTKACSQRDAALNEVVYLTGALAEKQEEIENLKTAIASLEKKPKKTSKVK